MKNGECCLEELSCNEYIDQCVIFGETFYIQLFINYNLFHVQNIKVWHTDRNLWAQDINIIYVSELHIKESNAVVIYCGFNQNDKEKYVDLIDYDFFEMRSIREKGIFNYQGKDYIVDDVKFVASNPDYMSRAYKDIDTGNLLNYLQELAKAPAGRRIDEKGQICLWDYNSCFINQKRGRRVTLEASNCKKKIHIFGDSRVSGYMLEDKDLFSNILQHLLNAAETRKNITLTEHCTMVDLIVRDNLCRGIIGRDAKGSYTCIQADYTVLATGGIGGLFPHSTN